MVSTGSDAHGPSDDWRTYGQGRTASIPPNVGPHPQHKRIRLLSTLLIITGFIVFGQYLMTVRAFDGEVPGGLSVVLLFLVLIGLDVFAYVTPRVMFIPVIVVGVIVILNEGYALVYLVYLMFKYSYIDLFLVGFLFLLLLPILFMFFSIILARNITFGKGEHRLKVPKMLTDRSIR